VDLPDGITDNQLVIGFMLGVGCAVWAFRYVRERRRQSDRPPKPPPDSFD